MSELKHANSEFTGFGSHSAAEVEQLQKALGLGGQGGTDPADAGGFNSYANQTSRCFVMVTLLLLKILTELLSL